jgi:hypothetical protein
LKEFWLYIWGELQARFRLLNTDVGSFERQRVPLEH